MLELLRAWLERGDVGHVLAVGSLVMARVAPLAVLAPWLGLRAAPATTRSAIVIVLTVALAPLALASARATVVGGPFVAVLLRESILGSLFAIVSAVPFHALESGGRLIDLHRGANLADVIAPPTGERTSPYGDLALLAGTALFAALGGVRVALGVFGESLLALPVGATPSASLSGTAMEAVRALAWSLAFATAVATPAAIAVVLAEVALGLVSRAVPRISTFFLGMPLRASIGLLLGLLSLGVVLREAVHAADDSVHRASRVLR